MVAFDAGVTHEVCNAHERHSRAVLLIDFFPNEMSAAEVESMNEANKTIPDWLESEITLQQRLAQGPLEVPEWVANGYPEQVKSGILKAVKPPRSRCCC